MKIISAEFIKGITGTDDILYDGKFQVAVMGRSNVGKSTLLNSLVMRRNLARSSSNPGKTVRMDFFLINKKFYFVDFPGYGYARVFAQRHEKIRKMILWYLLYSQVINRLALLITDAKVGITDFDRQTIDIFHEKQINHIIVANKIDNLKTNLRKSSLQEIQQASGNSEVVAFSSKLQIGRGELMNRIHQYIS